MLKLCKLAVHKLYLEGDHTRCQGVLDYGLNLHWNIPLIQSSLIHYQIKHVKIYLIQICNWIHIKFHSLIDTSDLNRLDFCSLRFMYYSLRNLWRRQKTPLYLDPHQRWKVSYLDRDPPSIQDFLMNQPTEKGKKTTSLNIDTCTKWGHQLHLLTSVNHGSEWACISAGLVWYS